MMLRFLKSEEEFFNFFARSFSELLSVVDLLQSSRSAVHSRGEAFKAERSRARRRRQLFIQYGIKRGEGKLSNNLCR